MMSHFDELDNTFDMKKEEDVVDITPIKKSKKPIIISNKGEDQQKDYQYARGQLYNILEKMQETLDGAMEVAQESEHPRAFEVAFAGAKHAADVVDKIADLHKKMKDLETEETKVQQTNTQNNVFLGSTEELMKMLKEQGKK